MTLPGFAILDNSAFIVDTRICGRKVIRAPKENEAQDISISVELATVDLFMQCAMPSEQQSVKWGIRCFKMPFDLLRLSLFADSATGKRLLTVCVCLFNVRTRLVGLKQIQTTYVYPNYPKRSRRAQDTRSVGDPSAARARKARRRTLPYRAPRERKLEKYVARCAFSLLACSQLASNSHVPSSKRQASTFVRRSLFSSTIDWLAFA